MEVVQRFKETFGEPIEEELEEFSDIYLAVSARRDCGLVDLKKCLSKHKKNLTEFKSNIMSYKPKKTDDRHKSVVKKEIFIDLKRIIQILEFFGANSFEVGFYKDDKNNNAVLLKMNDALGVVLADRAWIEEKIHIKKKVEELLKSNNVVEEEYEDFYAWDYIFDTVSICDDMEF